ncbi:MAG: TerC family protein, partial [Desulfobulbus sp.]
MFDVVFTSTFWLNLFSVTLIQIALGADNLIIITILANKLPVSQRKRAVAWGLLIAMLFRILLLSMVSFILQYATGVFYHANWQLPFGGTFEGALSGKAVVLVAGGFFLIWKGIHELRQKS